MNFNSLLITLVLFVLSPLKAQKTYVPDDHFEQKLIDLGLDNGPLDDSVLTSAIAGFSGPLEVPFSMISDFTGIEDFSALTRLDCNANQMTSLDLSHNLALQALYCYDNNLTSLILPQTTTLEILNVVNSNLNNLDISNNPNLKELVCGNNNLVNLDITNNLLLERLYCSLNGISTLDLTNNTSLEFIRCIGNNLSSIDLSNNTLLRELYCDSNQLEGIDLSNNPNIKSIHLKDNELTSLELPDNGYFLKLDVESNQLTNIDLSNTIRVLRIFCRGNNLETLNLANGKTDKFVRIYASNNPDLYCIQVDDTNAAYIDNNWNDGVNYIFDEHQFFSEDCSVYLGETDLDFNLLEQYPNPIENNLNLELTEQAKYSIYTTTGKCMIHSKTIEEGKTSLDLSHLKSGVYILKVAFNSGHEIVNKIIKQ